MICKDWKSIGENFFGYKRRFSMGSNLIKAIDEDLVPLTEAIYLDSDLESCKKLVVNTTNQNAGQKRSASSSGNHGHKNIPRFSHNDLVKFMKKQQIPCYKLGSNDQARAPKSKDQNPNQISFSTNHNQVTNVNDHWANQNEESIALIDLDTHDENEPEKVDDDVLDKLIIKKNMKYKVKKNKSTNVADNFWSFTWYDLDGYGKITKKDVLTVMRSFYDIMRSRSNPKKSSATPQSHQQYTETNLDSQTNKNQPSYKIHMIIQRPKSLKLATRNCIVARLDLATSIEQVTRANSHCAASSKSSSHSSKSSSMSFVICDDIDDDNTIIDDDGDDTEIVYASDSTFTEDFVKEIKQLTKTHVSNKFWNSRRKNQKKSHKKSHGKRSKSTPHQNLNNPKSLANLECKRTPTHLTNSYHQESTTKTPVKSVHRKKESSFSQPTQQIQRLSTSLVSLAGSNFGIDQSNLPDALSEDKLISVKDTGLMEDYRAHCRHKSRKNRKCRKDTKNVELDRISSSNTVTPHTTAHTNKSSSGNNTNLRSTRKQNQKLIGQQIVQQWLLSSNNQQDEIKPTNENLINPEPIKTQLKSHNSNNSIPTTSNNFKLIEHHHHHFHNNIQSKINDSNLIGPNNLNTQLNASNNLYLPNSNTTMNLLDTKENLENVKLHHTKNNIDNNSNNSNNDHSNNCNNCQHIHLHHIHYHYFK